MKGSEAFHRRPPGAPPPCRGCASWPTARLHNAFWPIHRRGLGAPGPDQGCPLWLRAGRWTRRACAIHPAALSRLSRGVASRDQPQERDRFTLPHATERRLLPGVGPGSLFAHFVGAHWILQFCTLFLRLVATRDSAAGPPVRRRWGWSHFGSAWGPSRGLCGRPSHPLGRVMPGSVTSNLAIHVTRTDGRSAGADLAA